MSDLISRSEVIKALEECNLDKQLFEKDVFEKIYEIQTAYDIDKLVEELKELKMRYFLTIANTGDEKSDFAYENVGNALDKAIEIVKHGCVSDDVCEWKMINETDECRMSCDPNSRHKVLIATCFEKCPYCHRKIKVVE